MTSPFRDGPTSQEERAVRSWHDAKTGREAWMHFKRWLTRTRPESDGDAPYWTDQLPSTHALVTGPGAKRLLLFQKHHVMNAFLPDGRGSDRATQWHLATASVPFAPTARDVVLIRAHARLIGGPIGFFGDLDPQGLHVFYALRSHRLAVDWLGVDDDWLRASKRSRRSREIQMRWIEREYWYVIQRLISNVRAIIGEECFAVLESGTKMESEGFADVMPEIIRRKCTRMRRRDAVTREAKIE